MSLSGYNFKMTVADKLFRETDHIDPEILDVLCKTLDDLFTWHFISYVKESDNSWQFIRNDERIKDTIVWEIPDYKIEKTTLFSTSMIDQTDRYYYTPIGDIASLQIRAWKYNFSQAEHIDDILLLQNFALLGSKNNIKYPYLVVHDPEALFKKISKDIFSFYYTDIVNKVKNAKSQTE